MIPGPKVRHILFGVPTPPKPAHGRPLHQAAKMTKYFISLALLWCTNLTAATPFETFKDWVAGYIPVKSATIAVSRQLFGETNATTYYHRIGKQEDSAFAQRLRPNGDKLIPEDRVIGYNATSSWSCSPLEVTVEFTTRALDASGRMVNPLRLQALAVAMETRYITQAGMPLLDPNTISWTEDGRFTAKSIRFDPARESVWYPVTGAVVAWTNGAPLAIEYQFGTNSPTEVRFKYGRGLPDGIPWEADTTNMLVWKTAKARFLSVEMGADPRCKNRGYTPSMFQTNPPPTGLITVYTNETPYLMSFDGETDRLDLRPKRNRWWIFAAVFTAMTAVGVGMKSFSRRK